MALLGATYDPEAVTHGWWSAGGVLSVAVLVHLTLIRVRQHRLTAVWASGSLARTFCCAPAR